METRMSWGLKLGAAEEYLGWAVCSCEIAGEAAVMRSGAAAAG